MEVNKASVLSQFIAANGGTQFVIPTYQRNYVWESKQIKQLLNDIKKLIKTEKNEKNYHYIGSIVYINTSSVGMYYEKTIIDGQQRLTTIFLILQTLKIIASSKGDLTKASNINTMYLENNAFVDDNFKYRLKPLISDDKVYELIAKNNLSELDKYKESNVYKAFSTIHKEIKNWLNEEISIDQIIEAIDKLKIVWIQLEKDENPQQVFESINSTGVNLTSADLIRNYILMNKDNEKQTYLYENYWIPIENNYVKTSKLSEFFRFYCAIKQKSIINQKDVYEIFKKEFDSIEKEDEDKLKDILSYARYYYYITVNIDDAEIEEVLSDYRNIQTNMPHPILMESFRLYENEKISKDSLIKTIKLFATYIIRRNMASLDTKSISQMFPGLLGRIISKSQKNGFEKYYDNCVECLVVDTKGNSQYMPTDEEIENEFVKTNLYVRDLTKFVLTKIENSGNHINYSNLNIEHVMPQTKTNYWLNYVNDEALYEQIVNRIGNLTLVDSKDNSGMSNRDFEVKKQYLTQTRHIKLNEDILNKTEWNEEEINKRSKAIARQFNNIFKYPECDNLIKNKINETKYDVIVDGLEELISLSPSILLINNNINYVDTWTDVYKVLLKYLYEIDCEKFTSSLENLNENIYDKPQVSKEISDLRSPYMFVEDLYCETNKSTKEKIILLRRIITDMNIDIQVKVIK